MITAKQALEQYENKRNDLLIKYGEKWIDWINKNSEKIEEEIFDSISRIKKSIYLELNYDIFNLDNFSLNRELANKTIMNYFISLGYYTDLNYFYLASTNAIKFSIFLTDPNSDKNE